MLEGLDGAGTTTQARLLWEELQRRRHAVRLVHEPSPGPIGQLIRGYLAKTYRARPLTLARLFAADRWEQMFGDEGFHAKLEEGGWVVSDRSVLSSLAYQGLELRIEEVVSLNRDILLPGTVYYLDIEPEVAWARVSERAAQKEMYEKLEIQQRVRDLYELALQWAMDCGSRVVRIPASLSVEEVHRRIVDALPTDGG